MKKKLLFLTLLLIGVLTFTMSACGDDDDDLLPEKVPAGIKETFNTMFPSVIAKWERERGLYKAEFFNGMGKDVDVYFKADGTWVRTVTDVYPSELPQVVKDYVAANYAGWYIDDADWVETPEGNYYLLELDREGQAEIYLRITEDGEVLDGVVLN